MSEFEHASEALHWYYPDGRPAYTVPGARGKPVKPDVRHARKLGLLPSVTSLMREMARPALERWKAEQLALAALTLPRRPNEGDQMYLRRLQEDAQAYAKQRAESGTAIHKAVEQSYRGEVPDPKYAQHVIHVRKLIGSIEGGFVGDFKTKDTFKGRDPLRMFYDEHVMQLAAYRAGMPTPKEGAGVEVEIPFATAEYGGRIDVRRGTGPLVSILVAEDTGEAASKTWTEEEAARGLAMFRCCLRLWQLRNRIEGAVHA